MAQDVRFIIFNSEEQQATSLRALLLSFGGAKIVAEVDEAALLPQAVRQFPVDIVLVNLDPVPDAVLPALVEMHAASPQVAVFATSQSAEGPLILKVMRTGAKEFLPKPIDTTQLGEAIEKVAGERSEFVSMGKLITILGSAGGVGATTIATNLAVELAGIDNNRVTIVDLDYRFGQVATLFDIEPTYTLADLCNSPEALEPQVIERALVKHSSGLHVLSRPINMSQADTITAASCVGLLSNLLHFNDYVIADGPSRWDLSAKSVLDIADLTLLITQSLVPTVRNAARILDAMRDGGYSFDRTKLVCNRAGRESVTLSVEDVAETLNLQPFAVLPDDWPTVSGAINLGETLKNYGPKSKIRLAIAEMAERLHKPEQGSDEKDTRKKGLIGRIFAAS